MSEPVIDPSDVEAEIEKLRPLAQTPWTEETEHLLREQLIPAYLRAQILFEDSERTFSMENRLMRSDIEDRVGGTLEGITFALRRHKARECQELVEAQQRLSEARAEAAAMSDPATRQQALMSAQETFQTAVKDLPEFQQLEDSRNALQVVVAEMIKQGEQELMPLFQEMRARQRDAIASARALFDAAGIPYKILQMPQQMPGTGPTSRHAEGLG